MLPLLALNKYKIHSKSAHLKKWRIKRVNIKANGSWSALHSQLTTHFKIEKNISNTWNIFKCWIYFFHIFNTWLNIWKNVFITFWVYKVWDNWVYYEQESPLCWIAATVLLTLVRLWRFWMGFLHIRLKTFAIQTSLSSYPRYYCAVKWTVSLDYFKAVTLS